MCRLGKSRRQLIALIILLLPSAIYAEDFLPPLSLGARITFSESNGPIHGYLFVGTPSTAQGQSIDLVRWSSAARADVLLADVTGAASSYQTRDIIFGSAAAVLGGLFLAGKFLEHKVSEELSSSNSPPPQQDSPQRDCPVPTGLICP